MRQISTLIFLLTAVQCLLSQPLQVVQNRKIVIDSDCGISDFLAVNLLLSRPEFSVSGIIISDGILDPENGFIKMSGFLKENGMDSIPVGIGKAGKGPLPQGRSVNQTFRWSESSVIPGQKISALTLLQDILEKSENKITYVCLGPLTSITGLLEKNPGLTAKIDRIIWYNDLVVPFRGFNYEYDSLAARKIISLKLRLDVISNLGNADAVFDNLSASFGNSGSSRIPDISHNFRHYYSTVDNIREDLLFLSDELVAIYLSNPSLFDINPLPGRPSLRYNTGFNIPAVKEVISDMVNGIYYPEENVVFTKFPAERKLFTYDVRQIMDSAIISYGNDEWKACVMTDEFHGHLGVYSIVGAKMGIRAREIFGVGPDILRVHSYAGLKPPYSCLNDGIQVSTGSTLGLGLISVAPGKETSAMADFTYKERTVRISLKEEYVNIVESDINEGIVKFGLMDDGYWKLIRQSALKYWLGWDRNNIFSVEEIPVKK